MKSLPPIGATALIILFLTLGIPSLSFSQTEKDAKQVEGFESWTRELEREVLANEAEAIGARFDENATIVWQDGTYSQGAKGIAAFLKATLKGDDSVINEIRNKRFVIDPSRQAYGDTIVVHGKIDQTLILRSGREVELVCTWTATVKHVNPENVDSGENDESVTGASNGQWKIISLQIADNVFDNSLLKTTRMWLLTAAIAGSLLGFLLGWFFTWFVTRSAKRLRENRTLEY